MAGTIRGVFHARLTMVLGRMFNMGSKEGLQKETENKRGEIDGGSEY